MAWHWLLAACILMDFNVVTDLGSGRSGGKALRKVIPHNMEEVSCYGLDTRLFKGFASTLYSNSNPQPTGPNLDAASHLASNASTGAAILVFAGELVSADFLLYTIL